MNIPGRGKAGDNYGAGTKAAPLPSHNVLNQERKKWNSGGHGARLCSGAPGDFQEGRQKKKNEKEKSQKMKLIYQHSADPVVITVWAWH